MNEPAADVLATVVASKDFVGALGGAFMISRYAKAAAEDLGLLGGRLTPYFAGRCGFLGDVDADVVVAAVAFFPPDVVRQRWESARSARTGSEPLRGGLRYAEACHAWGVGRLAGFEGAVRLAELGERIVAAVDVVGLPLFGSWRAVALPEEPLARVAQVLHLLREHRGGMHALAVVASGLSPLESVLAGVGGVTNAQFFEYEGPFVDPAAVPGLLARRAAAEELTDRLVGSAYAVLDAAERAEFVALLGQAAGFAFAPRELGRP